MIITTQNTRLKAEPGPSIVTVVNKGQQAAKFSLCSWGLSEPPKLTIVLPDREIKPGETFTASIIVPTSSRLMAIANIDNSLDVTVEPQVS